MHNELTNLLPPERQRALGRDYLLRFGVVIAWLLTVLVIAAALLLLPTYVFLTRSAAAKEARLESINSSLTSADETAISARLAALTSDASTLSALSSAPSASNIMRAMLSVANPGIDLSDLVYTPSNDKKVAGTITISGSAATRDALRNYQLALQGSPLVASAALPVSTYAKDTDITFTINVALTP